MAKITMVGTGYVGLVSGACLSEFGHQVTCVDQDPEKIACLNAGQSPIFEPSLPELIVRNQAKNRLSFTTDLQSAIGPDTIIFIAVGTPTTKNGREADVSAVEAVVDQIAPLLTKRNVVVLKSTVPVGTNRKIFDRLSRLRPDIDIHVASNPEFLREGSAIADFMRPDRVLVGCTSDYAIEQMTRVYRVLMLRDVPIMFTDWQSAELAKYAANAFLAMKVTFINQIADLCEATGANVQTVAKAMGKDNRIGPKFLHPGPGFGGSCFPKDTLALAEMGRAAGTHQHLVEQTIRINEARKQTIVRRLVDLVPFDLSGRKVALLGLTFKPETDDVRDAPSLVVIEQLLAAGAHIGAYDPVGNQEINSASGIVCASSWQEAVQDADAAIVLTEWNEFRGLDLDQLYELMAQPYVYDTRNVFDPNDMAKAGFHYRSIGRAKH